MKLSFVIPCYRSENTVATVVQEIRDTVATRPGTDYEIVLVNDCSPDNVWQTIKSLAAADSHIKGICLAKNFGQHSALMAGYAQATGDYVISLDDDGQTPASESFKLVDKLEEGYDVVYGYYEHAKQHLFRRLGSWVNKKMAENIIGQPKTLRTTSFFIMRKFIVDEIVKNKYEFKCQVKDWLTSIIPSFNNKDMKFSYELHFSDYWESICSKSAEERMDQSSLADFVTPDDPYVKGIADFIKKEMTGFKATELETANAILRLSQSFKYVYDSDQFGCEEYYMKPAELLYTQKGDCEDHAIFCASVMEALGYDSVLFLIETPYGGHAAAGVSVPGASGDYQTYNGTRYYFCEATATYGGNTYINYTSIDIGNMPDGYTVLKIIPVP